MKFILQAFVFLCAFIFVAQNAAAQCSDALVAGNNYIDVNMAYLLQHYTDADALVVDVREPEEHRANHIPNSVNLPLSALDKNIGNLPTMKNGLPTRFFVHCVSGVRSAKASAALGAYGYNNVNNVADGIRAWTGPLVPTDEVSYKNVTAAFLLENFERTDIVIIDTRIAEHYKQKNIPGSINVPFYGALDEILSKIPYVKDIFFVDYDTTISTYMSAFIDRKGWTRVHNVEDGLSAWTGPITATLNKMKPEAKKLRSKFFDAIASLGF